MSLFDLVGNYHDKANLSKKSYHQYRLALFNKEIMVLHMRYVIMIIGTGSALYRSLDNERGTSLRTKHIQFYMV